MSMQQQDIIMNGQNVTKLLENRERARKDLSTADRNPKLVANWVGESRSRIEFKNIEIHIGGEGELNPMQIFLASLAACDVDLIAMHAAFIGLKIESLSIEAGGHFNVARYLGLDDGPGPGYDGIAYVVRLRALGATPEQIEYLREKCERASPVGDSLTRPVPLTLSFEVE